MARQSPQWPRPSRGAAASSIRRRSACSRFSAMSKVEQIFLNDIGVRNIADAIVQSATLPQRPAIVPPPRLHAGNAPSVPRARPLSGVATGDDLFISRPQTRSPRRHLPPFVPAAAFAQLQMPVPSYPLRQALHASPSSNTAQPQLLVATAEHAPSTLQPPVSFP